MPLDRTLRATTPNPTATDLTYNLSVQGVPSSWVALTSSATVGPNGTLEVPLTLTSGSFDAPADYGFTVTASAATGAADSVQGTLALAGQPAVQADPQSRGVVAELTPAQLVAGQGTAARFVVRLTNTGSVSDTFALTALNLPDGVAATFEQAQAEVPPGASNYRDVALILTPSPGTTPGPIAFRVRATSAPRPSVSVTAAGTLVVMQNGVLVTLNPPTGQPGAGFMATVTNTGFVADTFDLALTGPAALVASLGMTQVTLAPGASRVVPITTRAADFAVQGALNLTAMATSRTNAFIRDDASAGLTIAATRGLSVAFDPATHALPTPGATSFLLMVENTGNVEDAYEAIIMGPGGPLAATLDGLDGRPTQMIPVFRLPGLATGAIRIDADLLALGRGTVTVRIRSLIDPTRTVMATATVTAEVVAVATTTRLVVPPSPAPLGQPITITALVTATGGGSSPGTVTFFIDGTPRAPAPLQVINGQVQASLIVPGLMAGPHTIRAAYDGSTAFAASVSDTLMVTVTPPVTPRATTTRLLVTPSPATAGRPVTFTALVTAPVGGVPGGTVMFAIDGVPQAAVPLVVVDGQARATLTTAFAAGDHIVIAAYGGGPRFLSSVSDAVTLATTIDVSPIVQVVRRFGFHLQPTLLAVTFSEDIDPAGAVNPANYRLVGRGRDGRFGTRDDAVIRLVGVSYDPATRLVMLRPARRLPLRSTFLLTVRGVGSTGIVNRAGSLLDGDRDGRPGGDFAIGVDRGLLAGPALVRAGGGDSQRPSTAKPSTAAVDALLIKGTRLGRLRSAGQGRLRPPSPARALFKLM